MRDGSMLRGYLLPVVKKALQEVEVVLETPGGSARKWGLYQLEGGQDSGRLVRRSGGGAGRPHLEAQLVDEWITPEAMPV